MRGNKISESETKIQSLFYSVQLNKLCLPLAGKIAMDNSTSIRLAGKITISVKRVVVTPNVFEQAIQLVSIL